MCPSQELPRNLLSKAQNELISRFCPPGHLDHLSVFRKCGGRSAGFPPESSRQLSVRLTNISSHSLVKQSNFPSSRALKHVLRTAPCYFKGFSPLKEFRCRKMLPSGRIPCPSRRMQGTELRGHGQTRPITIQVGTAFAFNVPSLTTAAV